MHSEHDFKERKGPFAKREDQSKQKKGTMEEERKPNEPIKPAAPGQQGGQQGDREKEKEREKQGGGQQGGGHQGGGQQGGAQPDGGKQSGGQQGGREALYREVTNG